MCIIFNKKIELTNNLLGLVLLEVRIRFNKLVVIFATISYILLVSFFSAHAQIGIIRTELQPGITIVCRPSYQIFLECSALSGKSLSQNLSSVLSDPIEAQKYTNLRAVAIPLNRVRISLYSQIFELLFNHDNITTEGWWHTIPQGYQLDDNAINLWVIALSGDITKRIDIMKHPKNTGKKLPLSGGSRIFFPSSIFSPELKEQLSKKTRPVEKTGQNLLEPMDAFDENFEDLKISVNGTTLSKELQYGKDSLGEYATYKLRAGETIYSVIVRFTDYTEHADILKACEVVKKRNKIGNERTVKPGTSIKIPLDMLSDIYMHSGREERRVADEVKKEVEQIKRTKKTTGTTNALKGVVVIIDPGHGGKDHGAPRYQEKIYEDEINYDIACRLKEYLEQKTQARVYITLKDESQNYIPSMNKTFTHDKDEYILVTPPHNPQDSVSSAHLRWLLANSIIRKEEKAKISREKMIYITIHCDAIYKSSIRGLMVYIPGANYYQGIEKLPKFGDEVNYSTYKEWHENQPKTYTKSQRINSEARSRIFAQILIKTAQKKNIAVHSNGSAIRNVIRRTKYNAYVPAVLRNTDIPTKVLIECANLADPTDLRNVADPKWRQKMAETIAEALSSYFDN